MKPEMPEHFDERYLRGIEYFNACEFFEAHEIWEELWQEIEGPSRRYYQGLIQAAVCLHHFGNGNTRGAVKLYHGCRGYLEPYLPAYCGLDLEGFLEQLRTCCLPLLESGEVVPAIEIDPETIPEIHLAR